MHEIECPLLPATTGLLVSARVVVRIYVVELQRRLPVDLHDGFSAGHGVVVHVRIKKGKAARGKRFHFVGFERIAHPEFEGPGNDGDVFA